MKKRSLIVIALALSVLAPNVVFGGFLDDMKRANEWRKDPKAAARKNTMEAIAVLKKLKDWEDTEKYVHPSIQKKINTSFFLGIEKITGSRAWVDKVLITVSGTFSIDSEDSGTRKIHFKLIKGKWIIVKVEK